MNCRTFLRIALCCAAACWSASAVAAVKLPAVFGNNMVLQCDQSVPVWGWADKGEEVTVSVAGQTLSTKTDDHGRWKLTLDKLAATGPLEMIVKGSSGNAITLKNVAVGEVWVCSGQSNMAMTVVQCNDAQQEISAADYPNLRMLTVSRAKAKQPADDFKGAWTPCSPKSVGGFSAVAYFFGRRLHKELNIPVGLIHTSWGGTPAEAWTSRKTLEANPALKPLANKNSSLLYNAMIAPLVPCAIRGAIWYQGEANIGRAYQYRTLLPAMIANWRADWGQGSFPFGIVQLAPFRYAKNNPTCYAELCEAQVLTAQKTPNTGLAVTMDIGNVKDIHPKNKQEVGRRLAVWALAEVYGKSDIVYSGPVYKSMAVEGDTIRLRFDHCGGGLAASDGKPLREFVIAGDDQKFVPAEATIDGETVVVRSAEVSKPVAVRYAWRDDAVGNLANKEGLPASLFRTDAWKGVTEK
jgi:sialate O-acetylesterase